MVYACGTWLRQVFDQIGGFDEELVRDQDDEFNYRLRKNGGKSCWDSTIENPTTPTVAHRKPCGDNIINTVFIRCECCRSIRGR